MVDSPTTIVVAIVTIVLGAAVLYLIQRLRIFETKIRTLEESSAQILDAADVQRIVTRHHTSVEQQQPEQTTTEQGALSLD